jgi:hypothetical protein
VKTAEKLMSTIACLLGFLLAGCGPSGSDQNFGASDPSPAQSQGRASSTAAVPQRQRQADFLNRIRRSDPNYQTIERAVLNEDNELGLILNRTVEMNSIPKLMRSMLTELHKEFPGQDLTVVAYAPAQPPVRVGTGRLDSRSGDMTYTPEQPPKR